MDIDTTFRTPLLVHSRSGNIPELPMEVKQRNNPSLDLQFYDSDVIFGISKEVASGYLVLLTGGEYRSTSEENEITPQTNTASAENENNPETRQEHAFTNNNRTGEPQSINDGPRNHEQTSSLAYAVITDGNVLHTCFGFKSGPNGRPTGDLIGKKQPTSIFCCFPSSLASSLKNGPSHNRKKELLKLVDVLREVKNLECQSDKGAQLNVHVIRAYVTFFEAIVKFHDAQASLRDHGGKTNNNSFYCFCPNFLALLSNMLNLSTKSKMVELQNNILSEIESAFADLKAHLVEELARVEIQTDVVSVAETGITVDECIDN